MADKVKELPKSEQPYEKCEEYGPEFLSDAELLSVILRSGSREHNSMETAREILKLAGPEHSISGIGDIDPGELRKIPGIGRVKVILLQCLTEYSKRLWKARLKGNVCFDHPKKCARFFMEDMRHLSHEEVRAVLLDTKANLISSHVLTKGLADRSLLSPRELFSLALKKNASQVIVLHNHPSGDPSPSSEDIEMTKLLIIAGNIIGVKLTDSIIIGDGTYVSMRERYSSEW